MSERQLTAEWRRHHSASCCKPTSRVSGATTDEDDSDTMAIVNLNSTLGSGEIVYEVIMTKRLTDDDPDSTDLSKVNGLNWR